MGDLQALLSLFAYDGGATDSGVHDEVLRQRLRELLQSLSEDDFRLQMSRLIREAFLSEEALSQQYGIEDALEFTTWLSEYMDCDI